MEQGEALPDHELESYLAALSPEGDPESTGSGRRFGGSQVYQLRLSLMANEQLKEIAAHNQTSPLALAQEWVMQRLEWEAQQLPRNRPTESYDNRWPSESPDNNHYGNQY